MSEWETKNLPDRYIREKARMLARAVDIFTGEKPRGDIEIATPAQARSFVETFKNVQEYGTRG